MVMKRAARIVKWVSPAVLLVELGLVLSGWLDVGDAVIIAVVIEGVLAVLMMCLVFLGARDYRQQRDSGADSSTAMKHALLEVLPGPVAHVLWHEVGIFGAIVRENRGRREVRSGEVALPYGKDQLTFIVVMCVLSMVEIVVVGLLVPWEWLRLVALVLGVYGMIWIFGFYCAMRTRPHVIGGDFLEVRCAHLGSVRVELDDVIGASKALNGTRTRSISHDDGVVTVSLSGTTNVEVRLRDGACASVKGETLPTAFVRFTCDDPAGAVEKLRPVFADRG